MSSNLFDLALNFHKAGKYQQAIKYYEDFLKKNPNNFQAHLLRGNAYLELMEFNKALEALKQAEIVEPNDINLKMNLAITYQNLKNFDEAICLIENIISQQPNNSDAFNNLGNIFKLQHRFNDAINAYEKALQIDRNNQIYRFNYCDALKLSKRFDEALDNLKNISSLSSVYSKSLVLIINILSDLNQYNEAILRGEKILANEILTKEDANEILELLIYCCNEIKDFNKGNKFLSQIKKKKKDIDYILASIFHAQNKIIESEKIYKKLIKNNPSNPNVYHNYADLLLSQLKITEAKKYFLKSLEIDPLFVKSKISLGIIELSDMNYKSGFENYINYTDLPAVAYNFTPLAKKWSGENISSNVAIYLDQGIGDAIFYSRFINRLLNYKNNFYFICDERIIEIFKNSFDPKFNFISKKDARKLKDFFHFFHYAVFLGKFFVHAEFNITPQKPFLIAPKKNKIKISEPIIGISWLSNNKQWGHEKSINLKSLLLKIRTKYKYVMSLQYGDHEDILTEYCDELKLKLIKTGNDNYQDISGLANNIKLCHEIYSISNVTIHLAGALGVKSNLFLTWHHEGRSWFWAARKDNYSLWYPSVRIFQANKNQSIESAINKI